MRILPPGSILQHLYVEERLRTVKTGRFLEVGSGTGDLSRLLLKKGFSGLGLDLNVGANDHNSKLNSDFISSGQYRILNQNFLEFVSEIRFDLLISCMVIEHLNQEELDVYFEKCKSILNKDGMIVILVPSSMRYWGIEDEIAGHFLRYERKDILDFELRFGLSVQHLAGLTYPLSNFFIGLSNFLVKRKEGSKRQLLLKERTIQSGNRDVFLKTKFPKVFGLILNKVFLRPFHWIQKLNLDNEDALVIYCELIPKR